MKNQSLARRFQNALNGLRVAAETESSFRTHLFFALSVFVGLVTMRPEPFWWALVAFTVGAVLAAELFNTALEMLVDFLHPEKHSVIGKVKDCAAAAVLVWSCVAVAVALALIYSKMLPEGK